MRWFSALLVICQIFVLSVVVVAEDPVTDWKQELDRQLPLLGHRNWIVVVDSAYPLQVSPGIKMIYTGEKQIDVVRTVLDKVDQASHVRGKVFLDAELPFVSPDTVGGIDEYRRQLKRVLAKHVPASLPHENIIAALDEAGKTFRILILKTDLTMPYTSVFIRLDCGYWADDAENALREAIRKEQEEKS